MSFSGPSHKGAISVVNYKGGVGKTTVSLLLAYYLANHDGGRRVLMLDIDAQCSLSIASRISPDDLNSAKDNIFQLVEPERWSKIASTDFSAFVTEVSVPVCGQLDLIKGSFETDELDLKIARSMAGSSDQREKELFLYCKQVLNGYSDYDYIIIDCPPNRMYLTQAMLRASTGFVIVTIPDMLSTFGMPRLVRWIEQIPEDDRPMMLGYILNTLNRAGGNEMTNMQHDYTSQLKGELGMDPIGSLPRLNSIPSVISGDQTFAALRHSSSGQPSVHKCMTEITTSLLDTLSGDEE